MHYGPQLSFVVCVRHVIPRSCCEPHRSCSALSLQQMCSVFVLWWLAGHQPAPQKAVLHCPYTVTFSLWRLRALRPMPWNVTEPSECTASSPKQRGWVQFHSKSSYWEEVLFLISIHHRPLAASPCFHKIMPIETPILFCFILICDVLTFWAREERRRMLLFLFVFLLPTLWANFTFIQSRNRSR